MSWSLIMVTRVCTRPIGRFGKQLLEVEPGNAATLPVACAIPLVAPFGLFGEAQWHDVLSLVVVLAKGALQRGG